MSLIIDASVTAAWLIPDEKTPASDQLLQQVEVHGAVVPLLWRFEVRNILIIQERRKRLSFVESLAGLKLIQKLPVRFDNSCNDDMLMHKARQHNLTAYDASYLELALRENLPLATFDKALATAAKNEGIVLLT